jgi:hypothetical protein
MNMDAGALSCHRVFMEAGVLGNAQAASFTEVEETFLSAA